MKMPQRKKLLILNVLDVLKKHSDAEHRLSVTDIVSILEKEYDMIVDRKSVKRNLEELENIGYHIDYNESVRKKKDGTEEMLKTDWYLSSDFSEPELRLIIDSLMCSKHISEKQMKMLVAKIKGLGNKYFSNKMRHVTALHQASPENADLFLNVEMLDEAINDKKQVAFLYHDYGVDKKMHPRTNSEGKEKEYIVNPYQLVTANGRYYLIGNYDKYDNIAHYRIDRIKRVRILDTPAKKTDKVRGLDGGLDLPTHMAEHIYMFGGECGMVTFKAKKYIINDIIDWFGTDVSFFKESEDEIRVATRVNYHAMKYWAMQYGYHVTVTSPPTLVEEIKNELTAAAKKYM
ncbi:MAG: WYL domain-containing protein [Clostridia bacterium]|nr:WYL domain-containing protein [Clostridia bacterium]